MVHGSKIRALTGVLLVTCALSGCSLMPRSVNDFFGVERTMPDGTKYEASAPESPVLNPDKPDNNIGQRFPGGNYMPDYPATAPAPAPGVSTGAARAQQAANPYPSLATVPPSPARPDASETMAQFRSLSVEQNRSEAAREQLMADNSATVMTSPASGQMVADPAAASGSASASSSSWPLPAPAPESAPASAPPVAQASPASPPQSQTAFTPVDAQPAAPSSTPAMATASSPASAEPIHLHPPAVAEGGADLQAYPTQNLGGLAPASHVAEAAPGVHLEAPSLMQASSQPQRYLSESRYAGRYAKLGSDSRSNY